MSRDVLYTEYALRILERFPSWPTDQQDMEKLLQTIVVCVEKCLKQKRQSKTAIATTVWLAYCKAYKERYKLDPPTSAKNYQMCKSLMDSVGSDMASEIVAFYLKQNDAWYIKSYHSLSALIANQNYQGLYTRMKTGHVASEKLAKTMEKATNTAKASMDYLTKKHAKGD